MGAPLRIGHALKELVEVAGDAHTDSRIRHRLAIAHHANVDAAQLRRRGLRVGETGNKQRDDEECASR